MATIAQQVFTTSGVFLVPAGIKQLWFRGWGGGGGGAGSAAGTTAASSGAPGGSGGGGSLATTTQPILVTPGRYLYILVGAGGANGAAGANGSDGHASTVTDQTTGGTIFT